MHRHIGETPRGTFINLCFDISVFPFCEAMRSPQPSNMDIGDKTRSPKPNDVPLPPQSLDSVRSPSKRKQQPPPQMHVGDQVKASSKIGRRSSQRPDMEFPLNSPSKRRRTKSGSRNDETVIQHQKKKTQISSRNKTTTGVATELNTVGSPSRRSHQLSTPQSPVLVDGTLHAVETPPRASCRKIVPQSPMIYAGKLLKC